jgi:hypothetical protein
MLRATTALLITTGFVILAPEAAQASNTTASCGAAEAFDPTSGAYYDVAVNGEPRGSLLADAGISAGDTITITYRIAPDCVGTPIGLAIYRSPTVEFDPAVTQYLADSDTSHRGIGVLSVTVPTSSSADCLILQSPYPPDGSGANTSGPPVNGAYNPTCSEPGRHGHQPATGSVGNADAKNPRGEAPNGTDRNAGYECDRNQGIGQGNPAHTSCSGAGWQVDFFTGDLLPTVGPPNSYYNINQIPSRLVDFANF